MHIHKMFFFLNKYLQIHNSTLYMINNVEGIVFNLEKSVILTIFHIITEPKMRYSLEPFKKINFQRRNLPHFYSTKLLKVQFRHTNLEYRCGSDIPI